MTTTDTNAPTIQVVESYRVAVKCKYLPVTNHRGSRIAVQRADGRDTNRLVISWDYALGISENYAEAVRQYTTRMEWGGVWHTATVEGGAVAVWGGHADTEKEVG